VVARRQISRPDTISGDHDPPASSSSRALIADVHRPSSDLLGYGLRPMPP
jgi:hypothetical protein